MAVRKCQNFGPQDISTIGKCTHVFCRCFYGQSLQDYISYICPFTLHDSTVYSLALLGYKKIPAYQVLCTSFLRNNLYYRAQECSNLLWALGTCEFGVDDEIFFKVRARARIFYHPFQDIMCSVFSSYSYIIFASSTIIIDVSHYRFEIVVCTE